MYENDQRNQYANQPMRQNGYQNINKQQQPVNYQYDIRYTGMEMQRGGAEPGFGMQVQQNGFYSQRDQYNQSNLTKIHQLLWKLVFSFIEFYD